MLMHRTGDISITPIGTVRCGVDQPVDENWGNIISKIEVFPEYAGGLEGLGGFSHAMIVTFLHGANYEKSRHLIRRPRGLPAMPLVGIFGQRAKDRPNPIGVTAVEIVGVGPDSLEVRGLDAIDGTPVIDIKPYYPQYDKIDGARTPGWVFELMKGYF